MQARVRVDVELIDRSTLQTPLQIHLVWTKNSLARETGWRTLGQLPLCGFVRKGFPTAPRLRPRPCRRPVARAATGVTPHSYQTWYACSAPALLAAAGLCAHAHHRIPSEHLIIMAQHSWNCCASPLLSSTSFINLISSITGCTKVKHLTRSIYSPSCWCSRIHDIIWC